MTRNDFKIRFQISYKFHLAHFYIHLAAVNLELMVIFLPLLSMYYGFLLKRFFVYLLIFMSKFMFYLLLMCL